MEHVGSDQGDADTAAPPTLISSHAILSVVINNTWINIQVRQSRVRQSGDIIQVTCRPHLDTCPLLRFIPLVLEMPVCRSDVPVKSLRDRGGHTG